MIVILMTQLHIDGWRGIPPCVAALSSPERRLLTFGTPAERWSGVPHLDRLAIRAIAKEEPAVAHRVGHGLRPVRDPELV